MTVQPRIDVSACCCDDFTPGAGAVSIAEALARIAGHVTPVKDVKRVPLTKALGRVLAAPVRAQSDMPRFDHAAMDGYALRRADLAGSGPWRLPVAMRRAAGEPGERGLAPGSAGRIFTGAPMPAGADCVVMQENVECQSGTIVVHRRPGLKENIRFRGEEYAEGAEILAAGRRLTARAIAAAASAGHGDLPVRRKVRVSLLVSGTEVARAGATGLGAAQIWDVNTPMLQACLSRPEVTCVAVETVPDDPDAIGRAIAQAAARSDLVITTGGVSVGEEDHLHAALRGQGGKTVFAGVAMKPGKPVSFGRIGAAHWLGLPGNPQSAFVTWSLFGEAILHRLSGRAEDDGRRRRVALAHPVSRKPGRCEVRATRLCGADTAGRELAECRGPVQSGQVGALGIADGLIFLPADADRLAAGALVEFMPFCTE